MIGVRLMIKFPGSCPVCASRYISFAHELTTQDADPVNLFYCMDCESFSTPFAPDFVKSRLDWHADMFERNLEWSGLFLKKLSEFYTPTKIISVGCGIGPLLYRAEQEGISGIGFDVDKELVAYGKEKYSINIRNELWTSDCNIEMPNEGGLITCISFLEGLKWPRAFFGDLVKGAREHNSKLYISVPFFNRILWNHLSDPDEKKSPLRASMYCFTHFTDKGFVKMCEDYKVRTYERMSGFHWPGYLITP